MSHYRMKDTTDIEELINDYDHKIEKFHEKGDLESNLTLSFEKSENILICGSVFIMESAKKILGMEQVQDYDETINTRT